MYNNQENICHRDKMMSEKENLVTQLEKKMQNPMKHDVEIIKQAVSVMSFAYKTKLTVAKRYS